MEGAGRDEEVGVEIEKMEEGGRVTLENLDFEEVLDKKIDEIKARVTEAVQEALANTLGDLLDEKEGEIESTKEIEAEVLPKCPKNISWLKRMFEILPLDILKNSKLWKYRHCVIATSEAKKEAEKELEQ